MSFNKASIINNSDKSYRRILSGGSHLDFFSKTFVLFLINTFNPLSSSIGQKLFTPAEEYEEEPIEKDGNYYSNFLNIDAVRDDDEFIDFLLSYQDDQIVTDGKFTTSFLQKIVGLTFGSVKYTKEFIIVLFKQFPLSSPIGKNLWDNPTKLFEDEYNRPHMIGSVISQKSPYDIDFYKFYEYNHQIYVSSDNDETETEKYYLISPDNLVDQSNSIPECVEFIKSYGNEIYKIQRQMNDFRIKHLLSIDAVEDQEQKNVLFTKQTSGQPRHTSNGNMWSTGVLTFYDNMSFRIDYNTPSILSHTDKNPVLFHTGKLAFTPSNWKDNAIISTIIYQKWHLNVAKDSREIIRINSFHPDMDWSIDSDYYFVKVSFPYKRVIEEQVKLIKGKITLDECSKFTQMICDKSKDISIQDLEKECDYSPHGNMELYYID